MIMARMFFVIITVFISINSYSFSIGAKGANTVGKLGWDYHELDTFLTLSKPPSGLIMSHGIALFFDTNPGDIHTFSNRFSVEGLYAYSNNKNSTPLIRNNFVDIPYFKILKFEVAKVWIGPLISFGGVYGVKSYRSYYIENPTFIDLSRSFIYLKKTRIKRFYFCFGGALGINIKLNSSFALAIEAGARVGTTKTSRTRLPSGAKISTALQITEGSLSVGFLYRIND